MYYTLFTTYILFTYTTGLVFMHNNIFLYVLEYVFLTSYESSSFHISIPADISSVVYSK